MEEGKASKFYSFSVLAYLIALPLILIGQGAIQYRQNEQFKLFTTVAFKPMSTNSMQQQFRSVYRLLQHMGESQHAIMDEQISILHYAKPHTKEEPQAGCPHCALIFGVELVNPQREKFMTGLNSPLPPIKKQTRKPLLHPWFLELKPPRRTNAERGSAITLPW